MHLDSSPSLQSRSYDSKYTDTDTGQRGRHLISWQTSVSLFYDTKAYANDGVTSTSCCGGIRASKGLIVKPPETGSGEQVETIVQCVAFRGASRSRPFRMRGRQPGDILQQKPV